MSPVSVVELPSAVPPEFERTPPQDVAAEQCVLGGMLLSKDAIADVVEVLRGHDFYKPAHQMVYDAIIDLYGRGEPADAVTVSAELTKRAEISRIGGAPYLHTLISSVPTAANAGYYAKIVRERAVLRRLVEAGTRIVQLAYSNGAADDVVDQAQAEVYAVTERRTSEDYLLLAEIMEGTLDEIDAINSRGGQLTGVPTGFADLDQLTNGLHPGQLVVVAARPAIGKALALDTPLPTPTGWTTMGEVKVGDQLLGADGRPTAVVAVSEVMFGRPCYRVEFSDGERIVADALHLWKTTTRASRRQSEPRTTGYYWSNEQLAQLQRVASAALSEPDRLVSTTDLLAEVGDCFKAVLRSYAIKRVPAVGREPRMRRRRANKRGDIKEYDTPVSVYSRQQLLKVLLDRARRPMGATNIHDHSAPITTEQIAQTLFHEVPSKRRLNHAVRNAAALELPAAELPLPPYVLGAWLGDGHSTDSRLTTADPEIVQNIESFGIRVRKSSGRYLYRLSLPQPPQPPARQCVVCGKQFTPRTSQVRTCGRSCGGRARFMSGPVPPPSCPDCGAPSTFGFGPCAACREDHGTVRALLRKLGVLRYKHVPPIYMRASETQRRELLAGLLDTDGTVVRSSGTVEFTTTSERLAPDMYELIVSLGYRCRVRRKHVKGRSEASSTAFTLSFAPMEEVFRLERKRVLQGKRRWQKRDSTATKRYIAAAVPMPSVPVRCVQVDNTKHFYLAGRGMIPTHNSTLALDLARSASIKHGQASCIFSLEMSRNEITMRLLSAESRVPLHSMRSGTMTDQDWTRLARRMGEVSSAPLFIDDSPNMSMMEIRAKCRRLKQRHDLRLVIVDYLQLMTSPRRVESRQQEVSEFSRSLKLLAKELDVPVVALSQLNRGPEQRSDKRPQLADLRESGSIEQDSDLVILLHREDAYERESPRAGEADLIVAKHRNGPTATVTVAFQGHYSRFVGMATG